MTINKDTKTPEGTTGFSMKADAIMRWTLNEPYRAELRKCLHSHLKLSPTCYPHKDLTPSRIKKDERDVQAIIDVAKNVFINPFSRSSLISISNGMVATENVREDLLNAKEKGMEAMEEFITSRLTENPEVEFFDPIKKMKLKTFSTMKKTVTNKVKDKIIPVKSHSNMFGQLALLMQTRDIDLREVFKYPVGPYPWSLCGPMGELRKTSKASLLHLIEKDVNTEEFVEGETVTVLDGMALVQKLRTSGKTFGELSQDLAEIVLALGKNSSRIDLVFDVYRDESIKNAQRTRRSTGRLLYQNLKPSQPVKQCSNFLSSSHNKREFIKSIVSAWKARSLNVSQKKLFVGYENHCCCFSSDGVSDIPELASNQEEADTRMLLHIQHEAAQSHDLKSFIVHSPDTDVFILCLSYLHSINRPIFFKTGVKDKSRFINMTRIKEKIEILTADMEYSADDLCKALLGFHAFTGCDTVSSFAGKGKSKPLKYCCLIQIISVHTNR